MALRGVSFGDLLRNPLVIGVLGTGLLSNLTASYSEAKKEERTEEQFQAEKLGAQAATTGEVATTYPRGGPFGAIATKLFGPNQVTPYETAAQKQAILGREQAEQEEEAKLIGMRKELGPEGYKSYINKLRTEGNPFQQIISGAVPAEIPPTPAEQRQLSIAGDTPVIEYAKPGTGLQDKFTKKKVGEEAEPGYQFHAPPKPDKTPEQIGREAKARAGAVIEAKSEADISTSPNPFFNPTTGLPVKGKLSIAAARQHGYVAANFKMQQFFGEVRSGNQQMDHLEEIAKKWLVPSLSGMSNQAKLQALIKQKLKLEAAAAMGDTEAAELLSSGTLEGIQLIHSVQGRYPSMPELKGIEPLLPGRPANVGGRFFFPAADDYIAKTEAIRRRMNAGISSATRAEDANNMANEAEGIYNSIVTGSDE